MTSSSDFSWYILQDDCSQYMKLAFLTSSILNWLPIFEFHHIDFWIKLNKLSSIVYTNCWEQWFQAKHLLKLFNQILPKVPFWFTLENKKTPWVFFYVFRGIRGEHLEEMSSREYVYENALLLKVTIFPGNNLQIGKWSNLQSRLRHLTTSIKKVPIWREFFIIEKSSPFQRFP